jgi:hypothetical protein
MSVVLLQNVTVIDRDLLEDIALFTRKESLRLVMHRDRIVVDHT